MRTAFMGFTAAQAAQKSSRLGARNLPLFTAAQAAQKRARFVAEREDPFTAAQAAQKSGMYWISTAL